MSFAYKKLNPADIKSVPYVANKQYEYDSSSYADNNIQTYIGEYIPITDDKPFDPQNDNLTTDQNYRRLIFESIRHLYYQNYVTKSSQDQDIGDDALIYPENTNYFWHSSSFDNYLQNTMNSGSFPNFRSFPYFEKVENDYDAVAEYGTALYFIENAAKIRVISIPKDKYGEGIKPQTFELSGSNFFIRDDGQGNLFDVAAAISRYTDQIYSQGQFGYSGEGLEIPVGNVFYDHGIAVITNQDYLCFIEGTPVARNDYPEILNVSTEKTLNILEQDFDDCSQINTSSVRTFSYPDYTFPDFTLSGSGDIIITPNINSVSPGEYRLYYSVENTLGLVSNTGSIVLTLTSDPLTASINSLTESCYQNTDNISSSVTFSIDKGVPPYSWSIDGTNYTPVNDLFQPVVSASIFPSQSVILSIKDVDGTIVTNSLDTSFIPISAALFQDDVSFCNTADGTIYASASGDLPITASLSASFSNSVELPNTLSNLEVGTYTVYLKDANNCTTTSQIEVTKTIPVTASYVLKHIDCFGSSTGEIYLDQYDSVSFEERDQDLYLTGGTEPFEFEWTFPNGLITQSQNISNLVSGTYLLNITDDDGCIYGFSFDLTSSTQIIYTASIDYTSSLFTSSLIIENLTGGIPPYFITASTPLSEYLVDVQIESGTLEIPLYADELNSGSCSIDVKDFLTCSPETQSVEIFGRTWELTGSNCEDGTGSFIGEEVGQRNLNFYTYEETGSEWVTIQIHSGSETPVEFATSGSATGSFTWNFNDTLYIDIYTGSNDNFYLRREFSGSRYDETGPANITGSEVTNSAIILGNANLINFDENRDVSLTFGTSHSISSLHITASKVNSENLTTNINFKFDRQIDLEDIKANFISEAENLSLTGSGGTSIADGSGSNFIARNDEFIDIIYGNTGSFIGPNKLLFRDTYAFGNVINTISGSNVEYTSGSIFSGSISASYFGGENAQYFTQRTDKVWMMAADIDNIGFLDVYSYTDADQYENDPIGIRQNTTGSHRNYSIFAGSQRMEHNLMYVMIIHEDEFSRMNFPQGIGSGEIFNRKIELINDVNRIYYLFMSPIATSGSQDLVDDRAIAVGKYFIDNVIYG